MARGLACAALLFAHGEAPGQSSSPAVGAHALPAPPANTQLPGVDPRQCGSSKWSALCAEGRWARFAQIRFDVRVDAFNGSYTIEHTGSGEAHATSREAMDAKSQSGEAVIVGEDSFAYRSRSASTRPDQMLDQIMTSPLVFSELVAVLLEAALPEGPDGVAATRAVNASSASQFILTQAPGAAVLYGPPWNVGGSLRRSGAKELTFDLRFRFRPVDSAGRPSRSTTRTARLQGSLRYDDMRERLPDTFDLVGWKLVKGGTPLADVRSLGEARQAAGAR